MALHIVNNSIACLAIYIGLATMAPTTFTEEGKHQITIRPLILDKEAPISYWPTTNGDTVTYNNALDIIAINLLETEQWTPDLGMAKDTVVFYEQSNLHVKYNMQIVFDAGKPFDYAAVVRTLERNGWIKLDTIVEQAYMITVIDSTCRINPDSTDGYGWAGAYTLQRQGLPILQPEGFNYAEWPVDDYWKAKTIDDAQLLLTRHGLRLEPCDRHMKMVRVTTLHDPMADL